MKLKSLPLILLLPALMVVVVACGGESQIADTPTPEAKVVAKVEGDDSDKANDTEVRIPKEDLQKIQDVLDIEVIQSKIAGFQQVGAVMATSEK